MDAADNSSIQVQKHVLIFKIEKVYTFFVMKLSKLEISVNGTGRNEIDGLLVSALSIQPYFYTIRFLSYFGFSIPKINANHYFDIKPSHNQETAKNKIRIRASALM